MTVDLYTRETGSGTPLVLLHAFPLSSAMWLEQREALSATCRVVTPDLRGFGGSGAGDGAPDLDAMADDVVALLDRCEIERAVIGGLSMGGYVTMALLRSHPERVSAVILADTKASADSDAARGNRERIAATLDADPDSTILLDEVLPTLVGDTTKTSRALVNGRVRALVQAAPAAAVAWAQRAMAARPDSFETLRAVTVPSLVIVGEEDALSPPSDAEAMADALPDSRLVRIPQAGHLTAVEAPQAFNDAVREFVAGVA